MSLVLRELVVKVNARYCFNYCVITYKKSNCLVQSTYVLVVLQNTFVAVEAEYS